MSQYGFYFDMSKCVGCRTCQVACKDKNNLDIGTLFRHVRTFETGVYPNPGIYHLSATCNHCEDPKCVEGCPTLAMHKLENGIVDHDDKMCIGCRYCTWNCPYGVPQYVKELGIVQKCDMCKDLVEKGGNPVCVDACMMRAIKFGELEELKAEYGSNTVSDLPILPSSMITNPATIIKPRKNAGDLACVEREV